MPRPTLVVQLDPPHDTRGGDWFYRTFAPGRAMSELEGVYVINCDRVHREVPDLMRAADVLVLNGVCDPDLFPVIADRTARGAVTVFEVSDDFSAIQPWNPIFHFFQSPANVRLYKRLASVSTAVQYTVPELARLYGHLGPEHRVFVNHLLDVPQLRAQAPGAAALTVGWGGSSGHREDIKQIAPALIAWIQATPEVTLCLMCSDSIWELFESLPSARKRRTPVGTIDEYYRFVSSLDVGVAPLADTAFNRSRSDVKFVEYAAHGAVAVLQTLEPYLRAAEDGVTARYFDGPDQLIRVLSALADDPVQRARLRAAAHARISRDRRQHDHVRERLDFYDALAREPGASASPADAVFAEVSSWAGAEVTGRHAVLTHTSIEQGLHDALVLSQHERRGAEAQALLAEVARQCPSLDLPHLYAGSLFGDADALDAALARNPRSVSARIALGRLEAAHGSTGNALDHFLQAIDLAPAYDEPYRLAAAAAERLGAVAESRDLLAVAHSLEAGLSADTPAHGA